MSTSYGYEGPEDWQIDAFNESHPYCECGCRERLCVAGLLCEGSCSHGCEAPGFIYDGLVYCEGEAADEARATLAEDIANHDSKVRNALAFEDAAASARGRADTADVQRATADADKVRY